MKPLLITNIVVLAIAMAIVIIQFISLMRTERKIHDLKCRLNRLNGQADSNKNTNDIHRG